MSFTVKDDQGKYVSGLRPDSIVLKEDGVVQHIQSFAEAATPLAQPAATDPQKVAAASSVFILFDTSNAMYEGFSRSEDEIENFIRGLDASQAVAVYSFSHNMTRLVNLTRDHEQAIRGMRMAVAGDSTALLNATLLTLRDAAHVPGRKALVVFSNGPDDSSILTPADVARVAEDEGVPIYIIATRSHDQTCEQAFDLLSSRTGGKLFLALAKPTQMEALRTIKEEMKHTYTVTYYPEPNANGGWRRIEVQVAGDDARRYKVTARTGYQPVRRYGD